MSAFASLCVLSYERPRFLDDCLESLAENAGYPFELIVHDDGSTNPECRHLIHEEIEDGRISSAILNPPGHNQGQGIALNRMFTIAKGDPIVKLDQDLLFQPGWLKRVVELLDSNREVSPSPEVTALGAGEWQPPAGRRAEPRIGLLGLFHYHHEPCDSANTRLEQFEGWSSRTHILGSAFAVPRECWRLLGPFAEHYESFGEDWEFQKLVTSDPRFVCGLPDEDLVENRGFGIGPSTVVPAVGQVHPIHKQPVVHAP